jgi:cyclic di-GMP phosphodiesterase
MREQVGAVTDMVSESQNGSGPERNETSPELSRQNLATILIGDSLNGERLLLDVLRDQPYRLVHARYGSEVLELLLRGPVDLVVLSSESREIDGLDCCRRIKGDRRTDLVPVLMLTGEQNVHAQIAALSAGADEFLSHPLHPELALTRIQTLLRHKAATDRLEQTEAILFALAQAVEQRDRTTGDHCQRMALMSLALGSALGLSRDDLVALYRGGYLHDIGKVGMPDAILLKPGPLDDTEWETMRRHPEKGETICRPLRSLEKVLPIIRSHHERWDGSGYPDGLGRDQIPLLARVLQLADIYDALTSVRPYKTAMTPKTALELMQAETRRGWRDPELMRVFVTLHADTLSHEAWRDAQAMQQSLATLQSAIAGTGKLS